MPVRRKRKRVMDETVTVTSGMAVDKLWAELLDAFLGEYERLIREGLQGAALSRGLDRFMAGLSDKPVRDLARTSSSVAYGEGRSAAILNLFDEGEARLAVRSEILDQNTCAACRAIAAAPPVVVIDSPEYHELSPPSKCLGGDRCRGFMISLADDLVAGGVELEAA